MLAIARYVTIFLFSAMLFAPASAPRAQSSSANLKPPVIAVLDMRVIQRESIAGKAWQEYYNAQVKAHKDRIASEEKALRPAWDELQRQRSIMAPEAFKQRERQFREKEAAVNRKIQAAEQEVTAQLRDTFNELRKVIEGHLRPIRDQIVQERGIDMIFLYSPDLNYVSSSYDITQTVLEGLDKRLPKVDIPALAKKAATQN